MLVYDLRRWLRRTASKPSWGDDQYRDRYCGRVTHTSLLLGRSLPVSGTGSVARTAVSWSAIARLRRWRTLVIAALWRVRRAVVTAVVRRRRSRGRREVIRSSGMRPRRPRRVDVSVYIEPGRTTSISNRLYTRQRYTLPVLCSPCLVARCHMMS